jgi:RNA recognition motif-containing protein
MKLREFFFPKQQAYPIQALLQNTVILLLPILTKRSLSMKMFVGNLIYNMTEMELKNLFSPFGKVLSSLIIKDQYTRQSKNIGYVEMAVHEEGKEAANELNGKEINNRCLIVRRA